MSCPGEVEESGVEEREVDGGYKGGWQGAGIEVVLTMGTRDSLVCNTC